MSHPVIGARPTRAAGKACTPALQGVRGATMAGYAGLALAGVRRRGHSVQTFLNGRLAGDLGSAALPPPSTTRSRSPRSWSSARRPARRPAWRAPPARAGGRAGGSSPRPAWGRLRDHPTTLAPGAGHRAADGRGRVRPVRGEPGARRPRATPGERPFTVRRVIGAALAVVAVALGAAGGTTTCAWAAAPGRGGRRRLRAAADGGRLHDPGHREPFAARRWRSMAGLGIWLSAWPPRAARRQADGRHMSTGSGACWAPSSCPSWPGCRAAGALRLTLALVARQAGARARHRGGCAGASARAAVASVLLTLLAVTIASTGGRPGSLGSSETEQCRH